MASNSGITVVIRGKILHTTAAAILIEVEGTGIWFPFSTIHEVHRSESDPYASSILVDKWIVDKKGLQGE